MMRIAFILSFILSLACASYGQMQMSMRGGGKPIYYPFQLDSLFYWFDAMDAASLLDSVGGAVTNDEGVATWADKSGNNWDVTQGTNTARPVYKATGGPGSKPTIQFDGSNDILSSDAIINWNSNDFSVFLVYKYGNASRDAIEQVFEGGNIGLRGRNASSPTTAYRQEFTIEDVTPTAQVYYFNGPKQANFQLVSFIKQTTIDADWYTDGEATSITQQSINGGNGDIRPTTNGVLYIGDYFIGGRLLQGSISEIIVYSRALTDSERVGVEQYLKQKWGL